MDLTTGAGAGIRQRRRQASMVEVQRIAVDLFERRGFDQVTVQEVAAAADVAPVSIYRWFGTKEALVLWDDYDPGLFAAIVGNLDAGRAPLPAVRDALVTELDGFYDADRRLVLRRTRLAHREPAVLAAAHADVRLLRDGLATCFSDHVGDASRARTLAAAAVGVLAMAVDQWQQNDGQRSLADWITEGFGVLEAARWD